jgi:hypothetical protein
MRPLLRLLPLLLLPLLLFPQVGCQSTQGSSDASLAAVTVPSRTPAEVNTAVLGVFRRNSFTGGLVSPGKYRFERVASTMNRIAYNDLFGEGVATRVYVLVSPLDANATRISCTAEIVQDPGDPIVEDTYKVRKFQKKPYQDLLNEVAARLK